jgi:hypothetical protein
MSLFFLALAVIGSRGHIAVNWLLGVLDRLNLAWWKKGLLITLRLYDRFVDKEGKNHE